MCFLKKYLGYFTALLLAGLLAGCATIDANTRFGERPDVQQFIQEVSARNNFNAHKLTLLFNQVQPRCPYVLHPKRPKAATRTWEQYRAIFLNRDKIRKGVAFWKAHEAVLNRAQQQYGVDPQIIIAILGVETDGGRYMGKYRELDALSSMAFIYHHRQSYFRGELEQYLLLTRDMGVDPLSLYGSFDGGMGYPQFMPTSYRKLAVSASPGKMPDLWHSPDDAILSIANYFHRNGWQWGQPAAIRTARAGINTKSFGRENWRLYHNFKVIKLYNNRDFYAMTVYQLGEAIRQAKYKP